jgi:hypothetical protein
MTLILCGVSVCCLFLQPVAQRKAFSVVRLTVEDNWGNDDFTCLYRFRVHGQPAKLAAKAAAAAPTSATAPAKP